MKKVKVLAVGLAMLACLLASQSAFAFGISEHEQITHDALGFMRTDVVGDMDGEHTQADAGATFENRVHFDGCTFKEGTELINSLYDDTIDELDPANPGADPWQAADDFGYLTHPTQDFYAHSNWVESGHSDLVDAGVGLRAVPGNWSQIRPDLVVGEGEMDTLPAGWSVHRDPGSLVPTVTTDKNQTFKALVSGHNDSAKPIDPTDNCADPITVEHSELNKDHDTRPNFAPARSLAVAQTKHEWCRLLNLLQDQKGAGGASLALALWTDPQHSPYPGGGACGEADPGPTEVTIGLDKLTVNDDTDPGDHGELNFVLDAYTTDFKRSAQHDAAGAFNYNDNTPVQAQDFPAQVKLCVTPTDTVDMTVQGWDDDELGFGPGNGIYDDQVTAEDEPLRGPTFTVTGDMSPGQHAASGGNLDAAFNVSTTPSDADNDGLAFCEEKAHGTDPGKADTDGDGLNDGLEVASATDPLDSDSDNDGLLDGHDVEFIQHAVNALDLATFRSPADGNRAALLSNLDEVESILLDGNTSSAIKKLQNVRKHLDGCGTQADGDDWIRSCTAQVQVRDLVDLLIANLGS